MKLRVWDKARNLNKEIYLLTNNFPKSELFGLTNQMRRSCASIGYNIAEGSGRNSSKEKARFTEIAYGSLMELVSQLIYSKDLGFLSEEKLEYHLDKCKDIAKMLSGLRNSQLRT
ncbi:MAG: four helix bundle protein [Bacteroidetes bacterium]|nr:four helix bundle protein [Bacteroidota bacterium]